MVFICSLFMRQVLAEAWPKDSLVSADDATVVIQTEIPKSQLAVVHSFVCRGVLSGTSNIDTLTTETFATFGIRLQDLTFEKVALQVGGHKIEAPDAHVVLSGEVGQQAQ